MPFHMKNIKIRKKYLKDTRKILEEMATLIESRGGSRIWKSFRYWKDYISICLNWVSADSLLLFHRTLGGVEGLDIHQITELEDYLNTLKDLFLTVRKFRKSMKMRPINSYDIKMIPKLEKILKLKKR